jgi:hypothetical protein
MIFNAKETITVASIFWQWEYVALLAGAEDDPAPAKRSAFCCTPNPAFGGFYSRSPSDGSLIFQMMKTSKEIGYFGFLIFSSMYLLQSLFAPLTIFRTSFAICQRKRTSISVGLELESSFES